MVDLHVHSNISDGSNSPKEIIELAHSKNLKGIALTDHDNIEGLKEASEEAKKYKIDFLKGIEISVFYKEPRLLHILGIGINPENECFLNSYNRFRKARQDGLERVLWILQKQGVSLKLGELEKYAAGKYLDRQAVAKCLADKNICRNVSDAWKYYLDPIPYEKEDLLQVEEGIHIIKEAGGLSFLAHYHKRIGLEGYTYQEKEEHIKYLVSIGLDGIERYYPSFSKEDDCYLDEMMQKYHLIPSGGTDFHGSNRAEIELGSGEGDFFVPDSVYENIKLILKK